MTLEEFNALWKRNESHEEFLEYLAALSPWAVFQVNRGKGTRARPPADYMYISQQRRRGAPAPTDQPAVRMPRPGERPPSRRPAGQRDDTIDRFDAYTQALRKR